MNGDGWGNPLPLRQRAPLQATELMLARLVRHLRLGDSLGFFGNRLQTQYRILGILYSGIQKKIRWF